MTYGYLCTDTQLLVLTQLTRSRLADYATRMLWRSANASPCVGRMYQTDKRRLSSMLLFERCLTTKWKSRWNALKALCQWKSASGRVSPVSSASHRRYFSGGFRRGNQVTAREKKKAKKQEDRGSKHWWTVSIYIRKSITNHRSFFFLHNWA